MVRRRWNLKGLALGAAVAVAAVGVLTFYVWYQTESVKLGLDINKSEARIREIEKSIEALKVKRAALLDPGRVERIARDELGLADPANGDVIYRAPAAPPRGPRP
jgi:cell division protein FtsL